MTDTDAQILTFEQRWYRSPGAKEQAIRDELGITPVRYYQRLLALLKDPEAEAVAPVLVHRLRRVRERRAA